jgi:hypothetical protein
MGRGGKAGKKYHPFEQNRRWLSWWKDGRNINKYM